MVENVLDSTLVEKKLFFSILLFHEAEREGFEPPEVLASTVFKTVAIDHSAISPKWSKYNGFLHIDQAKPKPNLCQIQHYLKKAQYSPYKLKILYIFQDVKKI